MAFSGSKTHPLWYADARCKARKEIVVHISLAPPCFVVASAFLVADLRSKWAEMNVPAKIGMILLFFAASYLIGYLVKGLLEHFKTPR